MKNFKLLILLSGVLVSTNSFAWGSRFKIAAQSSNYSFSILDKSTPDAFIINYNNKDGKHPPSSYTKYKLGDSTGDLKNGVYQIYSYKNPGQASYACSINVYDKRTYNAGKARYNHYYCARVIKGSCDITKADNNVMSVEFNNNHFYKAGEPHTYSKAGNGNGC